MRAVIKGVNRSAKGPQIVLSRTDPALLIKLFEQEVPEIYDGTVMIRGAVREAGDRAKVAVYSRERDVDPVGACVGMKGTRVQAIIRELRGEKIDIVEWSEDPVHVRDQRAQPGQGAARHRSSTTSERVMEVVVEDKQLSLAIGKKGQNVRLAAKLTGWRIDIKSEEEKRRKSRRSSGRSIGDADGRGRRGRGAEAGERRAPPRRAGRRAAEEPTPRRDRRGRSGGSRAEPRTRRGRAPKPRARRRTPTANGAGARAATCSKVTEVTVWQLFGFTKSRSC